MSTSICSASELFAISQGSKCEGLDRCHWCKAPCEKKNYHDDAPPLPFIRSREGAKNPSGNYCCEGCRLYRRECCTIWWLNGGLKDRQSLKKLSWWMTEQGARAVRKEDHETLWELLLSPPPLFCFSLLESNKVQNHLHHCLVNNHEVILAETVLYFTLDNVKHDYSVYELKECCKYGPEGKTPGVIALWRVLGEHKLPDEKYVEHRRGRPPKHEDENIRRVISKK